MKCPVCGAAELIHDTRDLPYTYKGETTTIPAVTGEHCPACSEVILDREHGDRYSEWIGVFQRQVNAAFVAPSFITDVSVVFKIHMFMGMSLFAIFPFTRLVHVWSGFASVGYIARPWQVVRSRKIGINK